MTEKQSMLAGKYYQPEDRVLTEERINCKLLCQEYNKIPYDDFENRKNVIKKILNKTGEKFFIEQNFYCDYGYNIEIGENFYSNHNLVILDPAKVTFGDNVFIGPNCGFYTAAHPTDVKDRNLGLEYAKPISVGSNVWFGGNVVVLPGINIGNNVIVAAGAVVTRDVPDNCTAAGVPAKIIKNPSL